MKRRDFLAAAAGTSVAAFLAPGLVAPRIAYAAGRADYRRLLILIELKGGNDGLNTVVPYADQNYYSLRPRLAVRRDEVLQLDERTGLHPSLKPLLPLWQARELAIVQGVGYPQPNLSHFRSIEIWDTASRSEEYLQEGWLARLFTAQPAPPSFAAEGVSVGGADLGPLAGGSARAIALSDPESFLRQARLANPSGAKRNAALAHILKVEADIVQAAGQLNSQTSFRTDFPRGPFGNAVRTAAQLAANGAGGSARAIALSDPESFLRQARLANPSGARRNAALAHILKVEADIVQAAGQLNSQTSFRTDFPRGPFGNAVRTAAQLAANGAGVAAIRISLGNFDTHQNQPGQHQRLLGELAEGIAALKAALTEIGRWDSTLLMTYSEFGRRPQENASMGTDHGTASAHFVAGGRARGGLYGAAPQLGALEGGNLRHAVDFRSLYATAIERWWGADSARALGGRFERLELLRV